MKTLMAVVVLGLPMWTAASDRSLEDRPGLAPAAAALTAPPSRPAAAPVAVTPTRDTAVTLPLSAPRVQSPNDAAGVWSSLQAVPTRAALPPAVQTSAEPSASAERLPRSGPQWYALIAAGIAAVGFMASRRTRS
ncbi:MAG: hypothetical protein ACK4ZD_00085 [Caldimonas sp.]|uniref:hypothetical protein n=1 Tax=Caldimonas sp. TaxID=2838790 RepID=UPI00391DDAFA